MIKHVVILCGGKSLRFETDQHKFLVEFNGAPLIQHLIDHYVKFGCDEISLAVGYKHDEVSEWAEKIKYVKINCVYTGHDSETGSRIGSFRNVIKEPFFLTYADAISNIDLQALAQVHLSSNNFLTITGIHPQINFGLIQFDSKFQITQFDEKPILRNILVSGGFFVCDPAIFRYIPEHNHKAKFETEIIPKVVNDNKCGVYIHEGIWKCLDTQKDYNEMKEIFKCMRF